MGLLFATMRGTWAAGRVAALTADHGCKGLSPSGQARHHSCLADGTHGHSITASARSERQGPRQAECLSHLPERPCLLSRAARRGSERPRLDVYRSKVLPPVAVHPCCGLPSSSWIGTALTIVTSEAHEPGCERCQHGSIAVRHLETVAVDARSGRGVQCLHEDPFLVHILLAGYARCCARPETDHRTLHLARRYEAIAPGKACDATGCTRRDEMSFTDTGRRHAMTRQRHELPGRPSTGPVESLEAVARRRGPAK